jgi:hypothetical protein
VLGVDAIGNIGTQLGRSPTAELDEWEVVGRDTALDAAA